MPRRLQHPQTLLVDSEHHRTSTSGDSPPAGPIATSFQQPCPACGRPLLILVEYLGQQVSCGHCRRSFVARDVSQDRGDVVDGGGSILKRAEQLLALLESPRGSRRMCNV
jgi:hypothetical protein